MIPVSSSNDDDDDDDDILIDNHSLVSLFKFGLNFLKQISSLERGAFYQ